MISSPFFREPIQLGEGCGANNKVVPPRAANVHMQEAVVSAK